MVTLIASLPTTYSLLLDLHMQACYAGLGSGLGLSLSLAAQYKDLQLHISQILRGLGSRLGLGRLMLMREAEYVEMNLRETVEEEEGTVRVRTRGEGERSFG